MFDVADRLQKPKFKIVIDDYFKAEVLPYVSDAWVDHDKTKIGYEIPLTRHFYKYVPPRPLAEIDAEIKQLEAEIQNLLREVAEQRAPGSTRFHHELVAFEQDESGVTSRIMDHDSGEEYTVRSRYLIAGLFLLAVLALAAMYAFAAKREAKIGAVCVAGAGFGTASPLWGGGPCGRRADPATGASTSDATIRGYAPRAASVGTARSFSPAPAASLCSAPMSRWPPADTS